jgi:N-acetylneuraminic acid mutarotase
MKLQFTTLLCALLLAFTAPAQWVQSTGFPGVARARSTAFTIDGKIYVMGGYASTGQALSDFWEYDIATAVWTQKPSFPGPARYGAASFVIGASGYIATGANDNGYLDDLWQYNTLTNSWSPEVGLPAGQAQHENQRTEAFAFSIGQKAYLGGGEGFVFGPNSTNNYAFPDLWEYDPNANTWTEKTGFPDFVGRDMAIAAVIGNKAYIGLGCNVGQTINNPGFWEYVPATDTWTSKAGFPTNFTTDAAGFVFNSEFYVVGGVNLNPVSLSSQFYKYDPALDTWAQAGSFTGGAIAGAFAVATDSNVFAGTGFDGSLNPRNDIWKFPATTIPNGISTIGNNTGNRFDIYPNPANDHISIISSHPISVIEIYDMAGRLLIKQTSNFEKVDVKALTEGIYSLKLLYSDGTISYQRFVRHG